MSTAALSTIVKTGKQTKCLSTDEWIKNMWIYIYMYIHIYYIHIHDGILVIKKNEINPICSIMDEPGDYHTKLTKSDKDKFVIWFICRILKKW